MHRLKQKLFGLHDRPPRGRFFAAGEMRLALLSLLADAPGHGYDLMQRLEARCGGAYRASAGTIYPTLQQLEDEGLIATKPADDGRKVSALTTAGKREVAQRQVEVSAIWQRAETWSEWGALDDPNGAEIVGPALRLLKLALKVSVHAHGDPQVLEDVREILDDARDRILALRERKRR